MIYKTIILKLHKPSTTKSGLIDEAILRYNMAFRFLLDNINYHQPLTTPPISKELLNSLNSFKVEPFKDALRQDALNFKGKANKQLPLYFCRYAKNRDFSLLYQPKSGKFYAKLYLLNYKNAIANPSINKDASDCTLVYAEPEQELFCNRRSKIRYLILPLAFGSWQEQYLKQALKQEKIIKTARLFKKGSDYFLALNLLLKAPNQQKPINYLGLMPRLDNKRFFIDYLIADANKQVLKKGSIEGQGLDWEQIKAMLSQAIAQICRLNNAQAIVCNYPTYHKNWGLSQDKLWQLSDYKSWLSSFEQTCGRLFLAKPIKVSGRGIYNTCPKCQKNSKNHLYFENLLLCHKCGFANNLSDLPLFNLATKLLVYQDKNLVFYTKINQNMIEIFNHKLAVNYNTRYDTEYFNHFIEYLQQELINGKAILNGQKKYQDADFKQKCALWHKLAAIENSGKALAEAIIIN